MMIYTCKKCGSTRWSISEYGDNYTNFARCSKCREFDLDIPMQNIQIMRDE